MRKQPMDADAGEALAARALNFLAGDPERLGRFLALSGIDPRTIRTVASEPFFLSSVLDHLLGDDRLLLAFSQADGVPPEAIATARALIGGPAPDA